MTRADWQVQPIDSTGGAFTLTLPTTPNIGDRIEITDVGATSATTGIFVNNVLVQGTAVPVQDPNTMVVDAGTFTYSFGSNDGGGSTLVLICESNGSFAKFWKVM